MRDTKFRAYDKNKGIMIYDFQQGLSKYYPKHKWGDSIHKLVYDIGLLYGTLTQFTGKLDSEGSEVYEGDIIQTYHFTDSAGKDQYIYHVIEWSDKFSGWFALNCETTRYGEGSGSVQLWTMDVTNKKVVGNIYENPKLSEMK